MGLHASLEHVLRSTEVAFTMGARGLLINKLVSSGGGGGGHN